MILGGAGFGNHVIYVDFNLFMLHIMEQGYHGSLVSSLGVLQAEWHDVICIVPQCVVNAILALSSLAILI